MNQRDILYYYNEIKFISQIYIGRTFTNNFIFLGIGSYTLNNDSVQINVHYKDNTGKTISSDIIHIPNITQALKIFDKTENKRDLYIRLFNLYRKSNKKRKGIVKNESCI